MTRPGIPQRNARPTAGNDGKATRTLRVLFEDGATSAAVSPSVVMPKTMTELSKLLAGDEMICVRRRREMPAAVAPKAPSAEVPLSDRRELDGDLLRVIDVWPQLPPAIHAAILALVDAAK